MPGSKFAEKLRELLPKSDMKELWVEVLSTFKDRSKEERLKWLVRNAARLTILSIAIEANRPPTAPPVPDSAEIRAMLSSARSVWRPADLVRVSAYTFVQAVGMIVDGGDASFHEEEGA